MGVKKGDSKVNKIILVAIVILVLIVLAVVVWDLIKKPRPTQTEPDPPSVQCKFACETKQKGYFCDVKLPLDDGSKATCKELASQSLYGVESCSSINCEEEVDTSCVSGLGSEWVEPVNGACPDREGMFKRKRAASDEPPVEGQICCYYYS